MDVRTARREYSSFFQTRKLSRQQRISLSNTLADALCVYCIVPDPVVILILYRGNEEGVELTEESILKSL